MQSFYQGMKLQLVLALIGFVFLESTSYAADSDTEEEVDKRRGWGKRDSSYPIDALDDGGILDQDLDKRRGWGKRSIEDAFEKRRGWGKRFALPESVDDDFEKRRGWGKRAETGPSDLSDSPMAKRRGWGKRSSISELDSELSDEMDKRMGWGKRSYMPLDNSADTVNSETFAKRRGWGKRMGWGKRADELFEDKRYGWGKRAMGWGKR